MATMKTRNCDFSGKTYAQELNIAATFEFNAPDGKYYKAELDISPESFIGFIARNAVVKPFPWQLFTRFTAEELAKQPANSRKRGTYTPAGNVNSIIASLIEEKVSA